MRDTCPITNAITRIDGGLLPDENVLGLRHRQS